MKITATTTIKNRQYLVYCFYLFNRHINEAVRCSDVNMILTNIIMSSRIPKTVKYFLNS